MLCPQEYISQVCVMATSAYTGFDKILTEYVGGHGLYQLKTTLIMSPMYTMGGLVTFLVVFSAFVPEHRCKVHAATSLIRKLQP